MSCQGTFQETLNSVTAAYRANHKNIMIILLTEFVCQCAAIIPMTMIVLSKLETVSSN